MLQVKNIEKYYGSKNNVTKALDRVSFDVADGEFIAIMGASGSGKTTLLNCISTIDTVSAGDILLDGENIAELSDNELAQFRRERLGFVLFCREAWNRIIRRVVAYISMRSLLPSPDFFLAPRQLFQPVGCPLCGSPGDGLDAVSFSVLPSPTLGGVPELALQLFCSREKSEPEELFRCGVNLFFYFCDASSPLFAFFAAL